MCVSAAAQVFLLHVSPELRRSYESMLLSQIEQVLPAGQDARLLEHSIVTETHSAGQCDGRSGGCQCLGAFHTQSGPASQAFLQPCAVPPPLLLLLLDQAAEEQRANKGVVTTAVQGPTRPKSSSINTSGVYAEMFKSAIDEVERNHATQVWECGVALVCSAC